MRCSSIAFFVASALSITACGDMGYSQTGTMLPMPQPAGTTSSGSTATTVTTPGTTSDTNITGALSLNVAGSKFATSAGKTVFGALLDSNSMVIGNANTTVGADGNFVLDFNRKLMAGSAYKVAYFVDVNGNGFCNISDPNAQNTNNMDAGFLVQTDVVVGNTKVPVTADATVQTVCDYFGQYSITITGVQFTPHNGQTLYVALMDTTDNTYVAAPVGQVIVNGSWKYTWPNVMNMGHIYEARYFADQAASGVCQNHSWIYTTPNVAGNISATVNHSETQVPVCDNFPPIPPN